MIVVADELRLKQDAIVHPVFEKLKEIFPDEDTVMYYSFPLYRGDEADEIVSAPLLIASKKIGVLYMFVNPDGNAISDNVLKMYEDMDSRLFSKFSKRAELRKGRRELNFYLNGIVISKKDFEQDEIQYVTIPSLKKYISSVVSDNISDEQYKLILSCIEGTTKIKTKKGARLIERINGGSPTKGEILNKIQDEEANFDLEQKRVALVTIDGPQRIRGLAGSGKTIVLTMKAAQYHLAHPDEDILYTFYTKSLHGMIHSLIERFYRDFSDNQEPNWNKIHILHGWGSNALPGVYSETTSRYGLVPMNYGVALSQCRATGLDPFAFVCKNLMSKAKIMPFYDLILIDEGQDFPNEFYGLCYLLGRNHRIVWAYDDFQNIFRVKIQDEKHTFGYDSNGNPYVDFEQSKHPLQDIVLHTCYRTPKKILTCAFSLGLGIYNSKVLQRIPYNRNWEALGFKVEQGDCENTGDDMIISRPDEYSPSILNEQLSGNIVNLLQFDSYDKECDYVVDSVVKDIRNEYLKADDICVICLDDKYMGRYYDYIEPKLSQQGIRCFNMLNAPNTNTRFSYDNMVTLSTVNRAKGNEAGMVYIVGADYVFVSPNDVYRRNKLFTSMTRAKGWVCVTGCKSIEYGINEFRQLVDNGDKLVFKQPSESDTNTVMSDSVKNEESLKMFKELYDLLRSQGMNPEDIIKYINK